jgi:hypothetical protein
MTNDRFSIEFYETGRGIFTAMWKKSILFSCTSDTAPAQPEKKEEDWVECGAPDLRTPDNAQHISAPDGVRAWVVPMAGGHLGQVADDEDTAHFWGFDRAEVKTLVAKRATEFGERHEA